MIPGYEAQGLTPLTTSSSRILPAESFRTAPPAGDQFKHIHVPWGPLPTQTTRDTQPRSHPAASTQQAADLGTKSNTETPSGSSLHPMIDMGIRLSPRPDKGHSEAFSGYLWGVPRHPLRLHRSSTPLYIQFSFSSFAQTSLTSESLHADPHLRSRLLPRFSSHHARTERLVWVQRSSTSQE